MPADSNFIKLHISPTGRSKLYTRTAPQGKAITVKLGEEFGTFPKFSSIGMDNDPECMVLWLQPFSIKDVGEGKIRIVTLEEYEHALCAPFETPFGEIQVTRKVSYHNGEIVLSPWYYTPPAIEVLFDAVSEQIAKRAQIEVVIHDYENMRYLGVKDDYYLSEWNEERQGHTYLEIGSWVPVNKTEGHYIFVPEDEEVFKQIKFVVSLLSD